MTRHGILVEDLPAPVEAGTTVIERRGPVDGRVGRAVRRPLVACLLLLAVYAALSAFNDPHAYLGTDTGGKVATLRAMDARHDLDPDLGYWARHYDPRGVVHPITPNRRFGDRFVYLTTLPMPYAAIPLYDLGGTRAIVLLPMLGAVACAAGARALSRRWGGRGNLAFWAVGLATPVAVYALDFWEHTLGLAAMAWGVVVLIDVAHGRRGWRGALVAGALFGAAATMRTEAFVYMLVAGIVVGCVVFRRERRLLVGLVPAAAVGTAIPLFLNQVLEQIALGAPLRSGRAAAAARAASSGAWVRVREAFTTFVGLNAYREPIDWIVGACIVVFLGGAAYCALTGGRRRVVVGFGVGAGVLLLLRFMDGLGFIPGLLTASPLAVVGLFATDRDRRFRMPVAIASSALPIVWAVQYLGGADPQWGGRYLLLSGFLLAAVGATALERIPPGRAHAFVAVAALVTAAGVGWLEVRSHEVAAGVGRIVATDEVVLVRGVPHLLREAGAFYGPDRRWLNAETDREVPVALRVIEDAGARRFRLVGLETSPAPHQLDGWVRVRTSRVKFVSSLWLCVAEYRAP